MEPEKHGADREETGTVYCNTGACAVDGFLETLLSKGGCIFCQAGVCTAPPGILSVFSQAAAQAKSVAAVKNPKPKCELSPLKQVWGPC